MDFAQILPLLVAGGVGSVAALAAKPVGLFAYRVFHGAVRGIKAEFSVLQLDAAQVLQRAAVDVREHAAQVATAAAASLPPAQVQ